MSVHLDSHCTPTVCSVLMRLKSRVKPLSYWASVGVFALSLLGFATDMKFWNRRDREGVVWGLHNEDKIISDGRNDR